MKLHTTLHSAQGLRWFHCRLSYELHSCTTSSNSSSSMTRLTTTTSRLESCLPQLLHPTPPLHSQPPSIHKGRGEWRGWSLSLLSQLFTHSLLLSCSLGRREGEFPFTQLPPSSPHTESNPVGLPPPSPPASFICPPTSQGQSVGTTSPHCPANTQQPNNSPRQA